MLNIPKFCVLTLLTTNVISNSEAKKSGNGENSVNFDFLIFAQTWPITDCIAWQNKAKANTCFLPKESKFKSA